MAKKKEDNFEKKGPIVEHKITKKKEGNFEKRGPLVEHRISKSKDRKWVILKTIITEIKSANYLKEVLKD